MAGWAGEVFQVRIIPALAEYPISFLSTHASSTVPVSPALGDPTLSSAPFVYWHCLHMSTHIYTKFKYIF